MKGKPDSPEIRLSQFPLLRGYETGLIFPAFPSSNIRTTGHEGHDFCTGSHACPSAPVAPCLALGARYPFPRRGNGAPAKESLEWVWSRHRGKFTICEKYNQMPETKKAPETSASNA
jgi:hypothetical protein